MIIVIVVCSGDGGRGRGRGHGRAKMNEEKLAPNRTEVMVLEPTNQSTRRTATAKAQATTTSQIDLHCTAPPPLILSF